MANFYISDLHLNHENAISFDNRPFADLNEMHSVLITNWNNAVSNDDTVYVLGDFIWGRESKWQPLLEDLSGRKVLITGNHDPHDMTEKTRSFFLDVRDYLEIVDSGRHVILSHYPIPFHRRSCSDRCFMLYGHVHATREYDFLERLRKELKASATEPGHARGNFINVGCMMPWMAYTPQTLEDIIRKEAQWHEHNPNI